MNFDEIEVFVQNLPGIYVIYTNSGIALKIGIGVNIRERLKQHRASRQSGLRLVIDNSIINSEDINLMPAHVRSKNSILAKHLFFDEAITHDYNLKTQEGRHSFLINECFILFGHTATIEEAQIRETELEAGGNFRYQGEVIIRN